MWTLSPDSIPAATSGALYRDYVAGRDSALRFYSHGPTDLGAALAIRGAHGYPRREIVPLLHDYNARIGASRRALENVAALADAGTMCVVSGQQAGFLGGPAYTAYKIATSIRLAREVATRFSIRCVPVFWLATEDHDFGEINHVDLVRRDGETGRVGFDWAGKGCPVSAMPLTDEVREAFARYWIESAPGPYGDYARAAYAPHEGDDYALWSARVWSTLFAESGLVVVEPSTLRPAAGDLFADALRRSDEIRGLLTTVAAELTEQGYRPQLTSETAGQLFTFDDDGRRVRVTDGPAHAADASAHPERYSTDAALRPLFADTLLPVVASVLGPGEIAYQGMLRSVYAMFGVPQPVLFPRKSYTVASAAEAERLEAYHTSVSAVLTGNVDAGAIFDHLIPEDELALFFTAEREMKAALDPLRPYLEDIDPSLGRTWEQTLGNAQRSLQKLQDRAVKSRLSQLGYSARELRRLQNALLPRDRLQERGLPLSHLLCQYGPSFLDTLLSAGDLYDFSHHVLVMGGADG